MHLIQTLSLLLALPLIASSGGETGFTTVFTASEGGFKSIRIPSVAVTNKGTVLAFAEGRSANSDQAENKIILKRSENDGRTWGHLTVIASDGARSLNNPCAVVDRDTGVIFLMFQSYPPGLNETSKKLTPGVTGENIVRNYIISSKDDGVTWTKPVDITRETKRPTIVTTDAVGPGIGVQISKGRYAGRLVFPFNEGPFDEWRIYAVYSDDHGKTWKMGDTAPGGFVTDSSGKKISNVNEAQLVELRDGSLRFIVRRWAGDPVRQTCVSHDGGMTWSKVEDLKDIPDPCCMGSVLRYVSPGSPHTECLLYAGPRSYTKRVNGAIYRSDDDGASWKIHRQLYAGEYEYSALTELRDGEIGCLFEADGYSRIVFARFSLGWIDK